MAEFYIETAENSEGEHIIHFATCDKLPAANELRYLGSIASYESAESKGLGIYHKVTPCPECAGKYAVAS